MRILAELPVREVALMSAVAREFRDSLVQQALTYMAPTLSGLGGPRRPSLARSELTLHLARGEVVQGKGKVAPRPTEMAVRQVSEWASDLSDDESVLAGMLAPGEYHYVIRTTDDEDSNTYYAFGSLSLFADGATPAAPPAFAPCAPTTPLHGPRQARAAAARLRWRPTGCRPPSPGTACGARVRASGITSRSSTTWTSRAALPPPQVLRVFKTCAIRAVR